MFPSNQNNNNVDDHQYVGFDYSAEDLPPFVQEFHHTNNNYDHHTDACFPLPPPLHDHQTYLVNNNNSTVVFDFKNPTAAAAAAGGGGGTSAWASQPPELDLAVVEEKQKKLVTHKEIERQRRQEMAKHHSSLRDLLPHEFIKGKRSVADHMSEAVNYISHLQNKINELESKREKLKGAGSSSTRGYVSVIPCSIGIQVLISCDQDVLLSKVIQVLVEQGHDIVSCVSNLVNHKLFHTIKSQVNDPSGIDIPMLQQKLCYVINSN